MTTAAEIYRDHEIDGDPSSQVHAPIKSEIRALLARLESMAFAPGGRLTLATGVPVMTSTQSAKTTIYYTPHIHDQIRIYDGTSFQATQFTELSQATTDTTKSPAAVAANKNYDMLVWSNAGTLRCTRSKAWSSDTDRGTGSGTAELELYQGVWVNKYDVTNGPAARRGTYVGSARSNASSQIDFILGASAAGGTAAVIGVWNQYNRVSLVTTVTDSNASWGTATSATLASMDGSTGNRISAIFGSAEDGVDISINSRVITAAAGGAFGRIGFALDATNVADKTGVAVGNAVSDTVMARNAYAPQLGWHFWQAVQSGDGTNAATIVGGAQYSFTGALQW